MNPTDEIIILKNELEVLRARNLQLESFVVKVRDSAPNLDGWLDGWGITFSDLGKEAAVLVPKPETVVDSNSDHKSTSVEVDDLTKFFAWLKTMMAKLKSRN